MISRLKKTTGILMISATLGLAGLSATADANMQPPASQCERDVRTWCYWNWTAYYIALGYDGCVSSETLRRCEDEV